jgi:hypothetical protein
MTDDKAKRGASKPRECAPPGRTLLLRSVKARQPGKVDTPSTSPRPRRQLRQPGRVDTPTTSPRPRRQRRQAYQPRATPWVKSPKKRPRPERAQVNTEGASRLKPCASRHNKASLTRPLNPNCHPYGMTNPNPMFQCGLPCHGPAQPRKYAFSYYSPPQTPRARLLCRG